MPEFDLKDALDGVKTTIEEGVHARLDEIEAKFAAGGGIAVKAGGKTSTRTVKRGELLAAEQKMADVYPQRDSNGSRTDEFRPGAIIAALSTGKRQNLSDAESKALGEAVGSEGGFLVGEEFASETIDRVRNATRVIQAGARTLPMDESTLHVPRMDDGVEPTWRAENSTVTEDAPTFSRVTLQPRVCAVLVKMSLELMEDASPSSLALIERELTSALALKLDYAAMYGAGTDSEPLGIKNTSGVDINELGAGNGATPTSWDDLVDAVAAIRGRNHEPTGYLWNSTTEAVFGKFKDTTNQPLQRPQYLDGIRGFTTNQIPNSLTVGSSTDCSDVFVGDWSNLLIGVRPNIGIRVMRLNEVYMDKLQVGIVAWLRADVALARKQAFTVITGVRD